jgi:hypothetical protein
VKELRGEAAVTVSASEADCFEFLAAVQAYPDWHPSVVRRAEVTERDSHGRPTRARTLVHLGMGPVRQDFDLEMEVTTVPKHLIRLTRIAHDPADPERFLVTWHIEPGPPTRMTIELGARLDVPRLLPLGGLGDSVAREFLAAAERGLERGTR